MELDGGCRIELRDGAWVVVDRHGGLLEDVDDPCWTCAEVDPDSPPLLFPTPGDALLA